MLDIKLIVENTDFVKKGLLKRMKPQEFDLDLIISTNKELKEKKKEFEEVQLKHI